MVTPNNIIEAYHSDIVQALKTIDIQFHEPTFETAVVETVAETTATVTLHGDLGNANNKKECDKNTILTNGDLVRLIKLIKFNGIEEIQHDYASETPSVKVAAIYLRTVRAFQPWSQRGMLTMQRDFAEWTDLLNETVDTRKEIRIRLAEMSTL